MPPPFPRLDRVVYPDRVLPVRTAVRERLIPDDTPDVLREVQAAGYPVVSVTKPFTSDSRRSLTVPVIASNAAVAAWPTQVIVQALGMAAGRRALGVSTQTWRPSPQRHVRRSADGAFLPGVVPDGWYDEHLPEGGMRSWVVEYSHGEFTRRRLRGVIHLHGRRPQIWLTPSRAHGAKIRGLLDEALPAFSFTRVITVDWTGGLHDPK